MANTAESDTIRSVIFPLSSFEDFILFMARKAVVFDLNILLTTPERNFSSFLETITAPRKEHMKSTGLRSFVHCASEAKPAMENASSTQPAINLAAPFLWEVSTLLRITSLTWSLLMLLAGSHAEPTERRMAKAMPIRICTGFIFKGG